MRPSRLFFNVFIAHDTSSLRKKSVSRPNRAELPFCEITGSTESMSYIRPPAHLDGPVAKNGLFPQTASGCRPCSLPVNAVVPCRVRSEDVSARVNTEWAGNAIRDGLTIAVPYPTAEQRQYNCHSFYSAPEYG